MTLKKIVPVALVLAAGGAVGTSTEPARAAGSTSCTPVAVAFTSGKVVQIGCSTGIWYYGYYSDPDGAGACVGVGIDVAKTWVSIAQAAVLAGKDLRLQVDRDANYNCLSNVRLCAQSGC